MRRHQFALALGIGIALGLLQGRAHAQGPTINSVEPAAPGSITSSVGPSPGSDASSLGESPGSGGQSSGFNTGTSEVLVGRPGPSTPKVPAAVSTPGTAGMQAPTQAGITLPTALQPLSPPEVGSLDFPSITEDIGPPNGMTLDQAIEMLVHENLQLRGQFLEIPMADADILTASLRANPILYADAQLVPYGQYSRDRPGGPVQYDLNISYPLDVTHKRQARTLVARQAKMVLEAQYQDAVRLQIGNLYIAFVDVLAARQRVRYAQASVAGLDQILRPLGSQLQVGKITPAEYNRVLLQREASQLGLTDAEENLRRAKRDLATLLNIAPAEAVQVELRGSIQDTVAPPPMGDDLARVAIDNRPDLTAFRLGMNRAKADVRLAKANRLNDIYVLYQPYTFQDNSPFGTKSATSWALGVTVPLPIYNRNQGNIRRAEFNVSQTQVQMQALVRQILNEVQQAEKEYTVSRNAVNRIETILRPAAERVLQTVRKQYEEGSIDVITFINARQEYNQVVRQYLDTLIRHRQSMLAINTAVGRRILP